MGVVVLETGRCVTLKEYGERVDLLEVVRTGSDDVVMRSLELHPGRETEFIIHGHRNGLPTWKIVTYGLGGERCTSLMSPEYTFEESERS